MNRFSPLSDINGSELKQPAFDLVFSINRLSAGVDSA